MKSGPMMVCLYYPTPKPRPSLIPVLMELGLTKMFGSGYSGLRPRPRPRLRPMGTVTNFGTNISTDKIVLTYCHCSFVSAYVLVSVPV